MMIILFSCWLTTWFLLPLFFLFKSISVFDYTLWIGSLDKGFFCKLDKCSFFSSLIPSSPTKFSWVSKTDLIIEDLLSDEVFPWLSDRTAFASEKNWGIFRNTIARCKIICFFFFFKLVAGAMVANNIT